MGHLSFVESWTILKIEIIWEIIKYIKKKKKIHQISTNKTSNKNCIRYLNLSLIMKKDVFIRVLQYNEKISVNYPHNCRQNGTR